jgi:uncharacterized protein (DUF2237 family)
VTKQTLLQTAGNQTSCCNKREPTMRQCRSPQQNYTNNMMHRPGPASSSQRLKLHKQHDAQTWTCLFKSKAVTYNSLTRPAGRPRLKGRATDVWCVCGARKREVRYTENRVPCTIGLGLWVGEQQDWYLLLLTPCSLPNISTFRGTHCLRSARHP